MILVILSLIIYIPGIMFLLNANWTLSLISRIPGINPESINRVTGRIGIILLVTGIVLSIVGLLLLML